MITNELGPTGRILIICELLLDVAQDFETANEVSKAVG